MQKIKILIIFIFAVSKVLATYSVNKPATSMTEELPNGYADTSNSGDFDLAQDRTQGNRDIKGLLCFKDIPLFNHHVVKSAKIQFSGYNSDSDSLSLSIFAERQGNPYAANSARWSVSNRAKSNARVDWNNVPAWWTNQRGQQQRTPDLKTLINEVIQLNNWNKGNRICFIFQRKGNNNWGRRRAKPVSDYYNHPVLTLKLDCPSDTAWSAWASSCHSGKLTRTRTTYGSDCSPWTETDKKNCVVCNATPSGWSQWGQCLSGHQQRTRHYEVANGNSCRTQTDTDTRTCEICADDSPWSTWSACNSGSRSRQRTIYLPHNNGWCDSNKQTDIQNCESCRSPSAWTSWTNCRNGKRTRDRLVFTLKNNGRCQSDSEWDNQDCEICASSPSPWSQWTHCIDEIRTRFQLTYAINDNGQCKSSVQWDSQNCESCITTVWTQWSDCRTNLRSRTRRVDGSIDSEGKCWPDTVTETQYCDQSCQNGFLNWRQWSPCCEGKRTRRRQQRTLGHDGNCAYTVQTTTQDCANNCDPEWSYWSSWAPCQSGQRQRVRRLGVMRNDGSCTERVDTDHQSCPNNCNSEWSSYSPFSVCDNQEIKTQSRSQRVIADTGDCVINNQMKNVHC